MKIVPLSFAIFSVPSILILKILHTTPENRYSLKLEAVILRDRSVSLFSSFIKTDKSLKTTCDKNRAPRPKTLKKMAAKNTRTGPII